MNRKAYQTLELNKIIEQVAAHADFSASQTLIRQLEPTVNLEQAQRRQQETSEARALLDQAANLSIGGARDVRPYAQNAAVGAALFPAQLLEIKDTLLAARHLKKAIAHLSERFPLLAEIAGRIGEGREVVAAIEQVIDENGGILDSASPRLATLRGKLRTAHDRLRARLQSIVASSQYAPYLQEPLITIRGGRYVIPVKAEYKGRIKGIVHDQSSSGQTLFIEPLATVEINNEIREMELAEEHEIERILLEVSGLVGQHAEAIIWTVETVADLDAIFARARYSNDIRAMPPKLVGFDPVRVPGSTIRLFNARHPLLNPHTAVPIDVDLDDETFVLIITGPNTGGKTVSLKTVGLLALMAQCGLHLPATDATLSVFDSIYADIGDEQSIEQSLSTFSAHLTHIIDILNHADDRSLVIVDELGSGTDPAEGAAIARAILNDLTQRGVTTFVATHYPELKLYAHDTPGVRNASVEFDVETLSPTYRLTIGLPGRSNAIAIATRLGLPTHILDDARQLVSAGDLKMDALLDEIHSTQENVRGAQSRLAAAEAETNRLREQLEHRLAALEAERAAIIQQSRQEAQQELETLRQEIADLKRRLRAAFPGQAAASRDALKEVEAEAETIGQVLIEPVAEAAAPAPPPGTSPAKRRMMRAGDTVFIASLNAEGEIASIDEDGDAEVQIGNLRVRIGLDDLELREKQAEAGYLSVDGIKLPDAESPGLELHLRGMTLDEALPALGEYLDRAYMAGLPWVRVIHGKGSGTLRKAIRDSLHEHPLVQDFEGASDSEGGEGVTVVRLAADHR